MKLVAVSTVREALRFDSIARNDAAIAVALETATTQLESDTRRKFEERSLVDTFRLYAPLQFGQSYRYRLALTDGLLSEDPTIVYGTSRAALDDSPQTFDAEAIYVNRELGEVIIETDTLLDNVFVRVSYDCGLPTTGDAPNETYDLEGHDWLRDAAIAYAVYNLITSNPDMAGGDKGPKKDAEAGKVAVGGAVRGKMRYFASAIRPMISGELNV